MRLSQLKSSAFFGGNSFTSTLDDHLRKVFQLLGLKSLRVILGGLGAGTSSPGGNISKNSGLCRGSALCSALSINSWTLPSAIMSIANVPVTVPFRTKLINFFGALKSDRSLRT